MKNITKHIGLLFLLLCIVAAGVFAISCDGDEEIPSGPVDSSKPTYVMRFITPEGVADVAHVTGSEGMAVTAPTAPAYEGHYFIGWYDNADGTGAPVTIPATMPASDTTYYAAYGRYTVLTYFAEGMTIPATVGKAGDPVAAVSTDRYGYRFDGWYLSADFTGEVQTLPTVMPETDISYYAKYTKILHELFLDANLSGTDGTMPSVFADANGKVTVPAATYTADGYYLLGWTTEKTGKLLFNVSGEVTQGYASGMEMTLTADTTLYAQWARGFFDSEHSSDMVYIHLDNVESGIGQAVLTREGKPAKLGFVAMHRTHETPEFTFYLDESEGGEIRGLLFSDRTFRYRDALYGFHVGYDHITDSMQNEMLYADGYGFAGVFSGVGAQLAITQYGQYLYDETYHEYVFMEINPTTGELILEENGQYRGFYFTVQTAQVDGVTPPSAEDSEASLCGYFLRLSEEAGSYYAYGNGEMGDTMLELNGYGWARLFIAVNGEPVLLAEGAYDATSIMGEWLFTPDAKYAGKDGVDVFRFICTEATSGTQLVYLFICYDETHEGTFTAANGETIIMDGYGGMTYTTASGSFEGNFLYLDEAATPNLTFYAYNEEGDRVATMYFDMDYTARTFTVNHDEFILDENGVLIAYRGTSRVVIIPAQVGGKTVVGIGDNVFKAVLGDNDELIYSVEEIVIPATVERIGALAFQNNYTLRRVTFLGETPPEVDFTSAKDPFRWPAGGFVIVVPEAQKAAYVTAFTTLWTASGREASEMYRIKGSVEVTLLPEFEVDANGTLVAYNPPADFDPETPVDLVLGYGQIEHGGADIKITAIAAEVFMGATWLRSIDLGDVTVIGVAAFENCTALECVIMNKAEAIGAAAFYGCEKLAQGSEGRLSLPAVKDIGANAFAWCGAIKYLVTGKALESVGANAFAFIKVDADLTTPLFVEMTGDALPAMANGMDGIESRSVFAGNSAYRIVIPNIGYAIKCYEAADWRTYCGALYIPSGPEKGTYIGGSNVLVLDGRAILDSSTVWLYTLYGKILTFYEFSKETGEYRTIKADLTDGVITFTYEDVAYRLTLGATPMTFTSTDGIYTLVVKDPSRLDPEQHMQESVEATLNGVDVLLYIKNYNDKVVYAYDEAGVLYDITFRLQQDNTMTYTKALSPLDFTAADGSTIRIYGSTHGLVNVSLKTLQYRTATGVETVNDYASEARAIQHLGGGMYAVAIQRGNDYYTVILVTEGDSFSYHTGEAGRSVTICESTDGDAVIVFLDGGAVSGMALLLANAYTEVTFTADGTAYMVTTISEPTASYTVTLDLMGETATITPNT